jgi:hypothetical protein
MLLHLRALLSLGCKLLSHKELSLSDDDELCALAALGDNCLPSLTFHILQREVKLGQD